MSLVPRYLSQNLFDVVYNDKLALMLVAKRQFCDSALFKLEPSSFTGLECRNHVNASVNIHTFIHIVT